MTSEIVVSLAAASELETGAEEYGAIRQVASCRVGRTDAGRWMRACLAQLEKLPCRAYLTISVADGIASWSGSAVVFNKDLQEAADEAISRIRDVTAEAALFGAHFSLTIVQTYQPVRKAAA